MINKQFAYKSVHAYKHIICINIDTFVMWYFM